MTLTAFYKGAVLRRGSEAEIAAAMHAVPPPERASDLLAFDDETGRQVDVDLRAVADNTRPRGRPALGVVAKEVTLLPRHWDWLASQRGGASASLRKLVETAMKQGRLAAQCHDAAFRFLTVMAGDLPKFEDAVREIYAGNPVGYDHFAHDWPEAIRLHGRELAFPA
ncbi:DUF2239 family protein [Altererythrobacter salegens]|uniref:DUF2239 family protein n=1 Tax=Croceibacterium salegens TaxID=1737568 RepID=A0A6I4SSM6_9SPHN|nr:DUF2239 family protein [Croceibacterium salegens]MXO57966.1 DUF2239 family protein [Croceibacterium salegens]